MITLGLAQIKVGSVESSGDMPDVLTKIGATYKGTCKLNQAAADVTEHFEEGRSAPSIRKKSKKMPILTFSIMDPDVDVLVAYVGGAKDESDRWGFNGDEAVSAKAIRVESEQGLWIDIPNADIDAVINAEMSAQGIFLVDFTVTPQAVPSGKKAILAYPAQNLTVAPTSLSFSAAVDSTGKTITASSVGDITYAGAPAGVEWLTVTKAGKVATVKVLENTNGEQRVAMVTIVADNKTCSVPVTQAGA